MGILCTWCGVETTEEFCSEPCRESFNAAGRIWAAQEYAAERLGIFELRACLEASPDPSTPTATNPETGETVILNNGRWVPIAAMARPDGPVNGSGSELTSERGNHYA